MVWLKLLFLLSIFLVILKVSLTKKQSNLKSNFCSKTVWYTKYEIVERAKLVRKTHQTWCLWIPPKCTTYSYDTVYFNETIPVKKPKIVLDCCPGYKKVKSDCIPLCNKSCGHGECIEPDVCLCDEGWKDPDCQTECEPNRFGKGCKDECTCFNEATCDNKNGFCYCTEGYTGTYCEKTCPDNTFGLFCTEKCNCQNGALCDPKNGSCTCQPGYVGENCEKSCESGFHGPNCENECVCLNETTNACSHEDGFCVCKPGYRGKHCENTCWNFTYGDDCNRICHCIHSDFCDPFTGKCNCKPGWIGKTCEKECPYGMFGQECSFRCGCDPSSVCDPVTGSCDCPAGRGGKFCEKVCDPGTWGKNCTKKCRCDIGNVCDTVTGVCLCKRSFNGSLCSIDCNNGTLGSSCSSECKCTCNVEKGICSSLLTNTSKILFQQTEYGLDYVGTIIGLTLIVLLLCVIAFIFSCTSARRIVYNRYMTLREHIRNRKASTCEAAPSTTFANPLYVSQNVKSDPSANETVEGLSNDLNPPGLTIDYLNNPFSKNSASNDDVNKESVTSVSPDSSEKHRYFPEPSKPRKVTGRNTNSDTMVAVYSEEEFQPEELTSFNIYEVIEAMPKFKTEEQE